MSGDCVRCGEPFKAGQFYIHVEYIPRDIQDLLAQPEPEDRGCFTQSPHRAHVDCPTLNPGDPK